MKGTRKRYPASFKARVALEAAKQTKTLAELSGRYQVHSVQISQWKKQLLDGIESLFRDGRRRDHDETQAIQAELYEQIGRLKMELEWLKKKVLPGFVWVKIQWSKPFVFMAWGRDRVPCGVRGSLGGRDQQDPQVPPPKPPTPFPSALFPRRIPRCQRKPGNHRFPRGPGHA
jgi:putative transposase